MKTILVVDDEQEIRELEKKKLEKYDYKVITASSGEETLEVCKTTKPDLIILDIAMPGLDGYAVAIQLKKAKATENIPIIFITAKELDPIALNRKVDQIGVCGFLMKPCKFEDLLAKIKSAIG